jgi:Do/DeqQ family serine protease
MSESNRLARLLVGVGLVLVGLMAGVLITLTAEPDSRTTTRIVERVPVGQSADMRTAALDTGRALRPDSGAVSMPSPTALNGLFRRVASEVTSAVVSVQVRPEGGPEQLSQEDLFGAPQGRQSLGSGVFISPEGHIVTNNHVVQEAGAIQVTLADKRQFEAEVVGTDQATDLAVIKIDGSEPFPVLPLGNSDEVGVGDWVVAVGNPFRLTSTVTAGIVSALGRQLNIIEDQFRVENFIQTDAAINPGNSGGALVNLRGRLVGINTAIASQSGAYQGYGFAVPSRLVERVVTDLIAYGTVRRGYLGVSIGPVNAEVASEVGLDDVRGVYVGDVRGGSAADEAGLEGGDVVVAVQGEQVNSPGELQSVVALQRPGDVVPVRVWRDGGVKTFDVTLMGKNTQAYQQWQEDLRSQSSGSAEPAPDPSEEEEDGPGSTEAPVTELGPWDVGLRPLTAEERSDFGVDEGVYVAYVEQKGRAAQAGLPRNVVITAVDEQPVTSPLDVQDRLSDAEGPVLVKVRRSDGTTAFYEIE